MAQTSSRYGLDWHDDGLDLEPRWTHEPSVEAIARVCRHHLGIDKEDACAVSFHAAGTFNRLYLVQSARGKMLMRVSLPVDPGRKTRGEVATLRFIRRNTNIPVPDVVAFNDSNDDDIGFEWILMELMPGIPLYQRWRAMSMLQKVAIVEQVADFEAQILRQGFSMIGTLHVSPDSGTQSHDIIPRQLVSRYFFWGDHFNYNVPRGPFHGSYAWLKAYLDIILLDQASDLEEAEDEEDKEDAERAMQLSRRLSELLPKIFPPILNSPERTVLWHDDLSLHNILVDNDGNITAVLDWECVSTMPLWVAFQPPKFLTGATRVEEPIRDQYGDESVEEAEAARQEGIDDGLDNEGKDGLYWTHLLEYEQTRLREAYVARMRQLRPEYDMEVADGSLKVDLLEALDRCCSGFYLSRITQWVEAIEMGDLCRLADKLRV